MKLSSHKATIGQAANSSQKRKRPNLAFPLIGARAISALRLPRDATVVATLLLAFACGDANHTAAADFEWDNGGGDNLWGTQANWNPETGIPGFTDNIVLTGAFVAGDQTIDVNGSQFISRIEADGANVGNYTFTNSGLGVLGLYVDGNALLTGELGGSLQIDSDVRLLVDNGKTSRFNVTPNGESILVNGNVSAGGAAVGSMTLELTSRNLSLDPSVTVNGVIADSPVVGIQSLNLTAGFAPDAVNHRGVVKVTGLNTYTGQTMVNGATLDFNSIADVGGGPNALGQPALIDSAIRLSTGSVPGTLRYTGSGHSSDRAFELQGTGGIIEADASATGALTLSGGVSATTAGLKTFELGGDSSFSNAYSGAITDGSGQIELLKTGTGTWTLSPTNTYSGGTTIEQGTLQTLGVGDVIPPGQFIIRDGTLDLTDRTEFIGPGAINQTGLILGGVAGATPEIQLGSSGVFSVSTHGTFIKYDATVNPGTAQITGSGIDQLNLATSGISRDFDIGDSTATEEELIVSVEVFNSAAGATTNDIRKLGSGRLVLTKENDFSKGVAVDAGELEIRDAGSLGLGDGTNVAGTTVASDASLELSQNIAVVNEYLTLAGSGDGGAGALRSKSGTNSWDGPVMLNADSTISVDADSLTIGGVISGAGGLTKIGPGTLTLTGASGYSGNTVIEDGTLNITGGGLVTNDQSGIIGNLAGSNGAVTVDGTDGLGTPSTWNNSSDLFVGDSGDGTLDINGGGLVTGFDGRIGEGFGSTGAVSVDGTDGLGNPSTWNSSGPLLVGFMGNGTLDITGGGLVTTAFYGSIGSDPGSDGTVTVDGTAGSGNPSTWNMTGMVVGSSGNGTLDITGGGLVTNSEDVYIALISTSNGTVTVDGTDGFGTLSTWNNSKNLFIGGVLFAGGNGTLNINPGGLVTVAGELKNRGPGTVNLTGGTLDVATLDLTDAGNTFNMTGGRLVADTVEGDLDIEGGTLAPGDSHGITNVTGSYTNQTGATVEIEIDSAGGVPGTDFDQFNITAAANLDGALLVDVGFTPAHQDAFQVMTFGSRTGVFGSVTDLGLTGDFVMAPFYSATDLTLSVELIGDASLNGEVGPEDYTLWANGFGMAEPSYDDGDLSRNGEVGPEDYTIWADNFGLMASGPSSGPAAVPEPSALVLAIFGIMSLVGLSRRRRVELRYLASAIRSASDDPGRVSSTLG